jgi:methylmalonyl-CoA/ethylmalonyl-CoA epimerase
MALKNIEHIGIAVKNLNQADQLYEQMLGSGPYKHESVASEHVTTSFFKTGETKLELLEATHPDSAISKFIEKRGEGIHHIAFEVDDIYAEMKRLKEQGFNLLNEMPKQGADNKLVCFVHPKSAHGVLIELCQEIRS